MTPAWQVRNSYVTLPSRTFRMTLKKSKTGFDRYFDSRMNDAEYATDKLVRALDDVRIAKGLSKAELARRISAKPEIVRRLFTAHSANPTITTVITVANALGLHLALLPNRSATARRRAAG
jgi:DNA-binding phage protein